MNRYSVINIRQNDSALHEKAVSSFCCNVNKDVEKFLKCDSFDFAMKNQSVTYYVILEQKLVGYFCLVIKPITIDIQRVKISNRAKRRIKRIGERIDSNTYHLPAYLIAQLGKNYNTSPPR